MLFLFCVVFLFKSFADEFHELLFAIRKCVAVFEPENIRYARLKLAQNERVVELFYAYSAILYEYIHVIQKQCGDSRLVPLIEYVADAVEKIAEEQQIKNIKTVTLEIGEVSGIVPEYLVDCWNYFRKRYPALENAELDYEILEAATYCEDCGKQYLTVQYGRICPHCQSERTYLIRGRECNIKEVAVIGE